ncbi:MAG: hypothetical protein R6V41_02970 [Desulfobacteraceae bacterium]
MKHYNSGGNLSLNDRIKELAREINMQSRLISSIVEQGRHGAAEKNPGTVFTPHPDPRKADLEEAVKEAVNVLEQSRKSFKSKQLADLRKKLNRILLDSDTPV